MPSYLALAHAGIFQVILHEWITLRDIVQLDTALCSKEFRAAIHDKMHLLPLAQPFGPHKQQAKLWREIRPQALEWMRARGICLLDGQWELDVKSWTSYLDCILIPGRLQSLKLVVEQRHSFALRQLQICPCLVELALEGVAESPDWPAVDFATMLPSLRRVSLISCDLNPPSLESLGNHSELSYIECLDCSFSNLMRHSRGTRLAGLTPFFQKIRKLRLVGSGELLAITPYFNSECCVEDAEFCHFCFDGDDLALMPLMFNLPSIRRLSLIYCTHFIPIQLEDTRPFLPNLQVLRLEGSFLPLDLLELLNSCTRLHTLVLQSQTINQYHRDMFRDFYSRLRTFHTDIVGYTSRTIQHHMFYLPRNNITSACLDNWSRKCDVTESLVDFIEKSPFLEDLCIGRCQMVGGSVFREIKRQRPLLKRLALEECLWQPPAEESTEQVEEGGGGSLQYLSISAIPPPSSSSSRSHASTSSIEADRQHGMIDAVIDALRYFGNTMSLELILPGKCSRDWLEKMAPYLSGIQSLTINLVAGMELPALLPSLACHLPALQSVTVYSWKSAVHYRERQVRTNLRKLAYRWRRQSTG